MRSRLVVALLLLFASVGVSGGARVDAATITAVWAIGYDAPIVLNDYGVDGAGVFTLNDGGSEMLAWCLEAQNAHSTASEAYSPAANEFNSSRLDFLTFWYLTVGGSGERVSGPRAAAGQFLVWYYVGATRSGALAGYPVWANTETGFSAVSPAAPEAWNALAPYSVAHPVGIRDAGGADLDGFEGEVWAMYRNAEANFGPWSMDAISYDADAGTASATIRNGGGTPITVPQSWRWIVTDSSGGEVQNVVAPNNASGVASASGIAIPDGGNIRIEGWGPGTHAEYDGTGIQRVAIAGDRVLLARDLPVEPSVDERYFRLRKTSSDPTLSVAGGVFAIVDGSGDEVSRVTSDATGIVDFPVIDVMGDNEPPYSLVEVSAPAGLVANSDPIPFPIPYSADPDNPTSITLNNTPRAEQLEIRKMVSGAAGAPADLSGFEFAVTRVVDGADYGVHATDEVGETQRIEVTAGDYSVAEVGRPAWWPAGDPLPAPMMVTVPANGTATVVVEYRNVLPGLEVGTSAVDQADGDKVVATSGGTVTDTVRICDAVAGTEYRVDGELMSVAGDGTATATGIVATTTFTSNPGDDGCEMVDLDFDVPADSVFANGGVGVVFETVSDVATNTEVGSHRDADDPAQTVYFPTVGTSASDQADGDKVLPLTGGTVVDVVAYDNVVPGIEYVVDGELMFVNEDGTATATGIVGSTPFTSETASGTVEVTFDVPAESRFSNGGVGVVFEFLTVAEFPDVPVASHEDPDDPAQMVFFPTVGTWASDQADGDKVLPLTGGTVVDVVAYDNVVPGIEYVVDGELMFVNEDGTATATGIVGSTPFTSETASGTVEVTFDVPAESRFSNGGVGVVFEFLTVAEFPDVPVASHEDPDDVEQTVYFPSAGTRLVAVTDEVTEASKFAGVDTRLVDVVEYILGPGEYRADMVLQSRSVDGVCTATSTVASTSWTVEPGAPFGSVEVGPFTVPDVGATYVAYEVVYEIGDDGEDIERASHEDCDDLDQTVTAPGMETTVARPAPVGPGEQVDKLTVSGFVYGIPEGATATVEVNVHSHRATSPVGGRVCDASNRGATSTVALSGDGEYESPGELFALGASSYENRFIISFADGSMWESDAHGCNEASESWIATPSAATPSAATPSKTIARAGTDATRIMLLMGAGLLVAGLATWLVSRRRDRDDELVAAAGAGS